MTIEEVWTRQHIGALRADVLARGLGFMLYLTSLGHWGKRTLPAYLEVYPVSSFALGLCGFALMVAGPRLVTFVCSAITGASFFWTVLAGRGGPRLHQQAAEYPMLMLIPAALAVLALVLFFTQRRGRAHQNVPAAADGSDSWRRFNTDFEQSAMSVFRWAALCTLFFAGFHKLNTDFFTLHTSCEQVIKEYAARNWSLPGLEWALQQTSPALIVLFESAVPILLLLLLPRLGLLAVVLFYGGISLTDALVVTLCIIIPALAFLPKRDWRLLRVGWKGPVFVWAALLFAWLPFSSVHYRGSRPWLQPALYQGLLLLILAMLVWLLWRHGSGCAGTQREGWLVWRGGDSLQQRCGALGSRVRSKWCWFAGWRCCW